MEFNSLGFLPGKVPAEILEKIVFRYLGADRKEVAVGPSIGVDGAVIDVGDFSIIVSADPITGALERVGWLAVNVNANDVATFGVRPQFFASCLLLPEDAEERTIETICRQMDEAARKLGMAIIGGHCEVTPGLTHPLIVGCTVGVTQRGNYVTSKGAEPGNKLIITKTVGIEGTAILANDRESWLRGKLNRRLLETAKDFFDLISVVEEATLAFEAGGVTAMHDPTEGGVAGGIHELADASNVGFQIFEERIPIARETFEICRIFRIDPLQLISSGTLLIVAKETNASKIIKKLRDREIRASLIGEILENPMERILVGKDCSKRELVRPISDHLWLALEKGEAN
jgi:hydrogenase maturation factor